MTRELFVSSTPHETKVGLVEDDLLAEIYLERENEYTLAGSIYKGRVTRVLPGMQSAFVDIGLDRAAFLHLADIWRLRQSEDADKPIERLLYEGKNILVQVIKDSISTKGARLSTQVSIAGRMLVYLPQVSHIGISQRIEDETERKPRAAVERPTPDAHMRSRSACQRRGSIVSRNGRHDQLSRFL